MKLSDALPEALRESRAIEVLERSLTQNRLGHGILLHGENSGLLESIVRAIAARLLETDRDPFTHPDCFTLRPEGRARMIKIGSESERVGGEWPHNTMRRLIADVQKSSNQGGRKVAIVFEAEQMNRQATNAFLKTLEEPPAGTTVFLLTTRPYDLLDTIRSRCLNFRIPAGLEEPRDAAWKDWKTNYQNWLATLTGGLSSKAAIADTLLAAYGLNARFQGILAALTEAAWKERKEALPEGITTDQMKAIESGISKGFRKQLYGEIEKATIEFAREVEARTPGALPVVPMTQANEALEHAAGLLIVNFNEAAALELFFLKSLRIWTRR